MSAVSPPECKMSLPRHLSLLLEKKTGKRCNWGFVDTDRPRPTPSAPVGACSRALLGVDYHPHNQGGGAQSFLLVTVAPSDRRLAEHPPPFCVVNPCEARSSGWVILPPHPSQTDWVPAGPRPVAARVGVRPVGHPPAFQAQSGFVGPAGDWLGARRLVENLVSAEKGGERRAAPPPPPGGGASLSSSGPAREPAHNHSLPALAPFHPQAPIQLSTCILLFSQSLGNPPPLSPPSFFLAPPAYPTLAWLTLTHPDAIFSPPSLWSLASQIRGSFPRQPWPSPTPPGMGGWVGGCVC